MRRIKAIATLILVIVLIFSSVALAGDEKYHDDYMCSVIFGFHEGTCTESAQGQKALEALEAASFLCLDLTNQPKGEDSLTVLRNYKVSNLPASTSEISFSGNQYHRRYTHRGWESGYGSQPEDKGHWAIRKELLIATSQKIFGFTDAKQCESFSAFIYYVHVIGDYLCCNTYTDTLNMIALAYEHPGSTNRDLFYDLQYHIPIMLADNKQKGSAKYSAFMGELNTLADRARSLVSVTGGIQSNKPGKPDLFDEYIGYADQLMTLLKDYMPELLQNETFFHNVFY